VTSGSSKTRPESDLLHIGYIRMSERPSFKGQ
jgi:hypothetical protein